MKYRYTHDGCEWSPTRGEAAYSDDPHWLDRSVKAAWIVGAGGKWRLCEGCAALPEFKRFRSRVRIPTESGGRPVTDRHPNPTASPGPHSETPTN